MHTNYLLKYKTPLTFIFLLIAFIPYIYISYYCNPIADDFSFATRTRDTELLQVLLKSYNTWSGRYTSNLFNVINPISYNIFWLYKLIPVIIISLITISFNFFIRSIVGENLKRIESLSYSLLLALLFLYQMPIISEGIYWYTASTSYTLGCIFLSFLLGLLCMLFTKRYLLHSKYVHLLITALILFITIGFIEMSALILLMVSFTIYTIILKKKLEDKNIALFILIATILFSFISFFAPGNAVRGSLYSDNHHFFYSVGMSSVQTARFFLSWVSSIPLLLISVLYYNFNKKICRTNKLFASSFYLTPLMSILLLLFVIFIGSFLPYWATGMLGQHRTMNVSYFLFIISWFICLTVFFNYKANCNFQLDNKTKWSISLLIWGALVFTKNGYHLIVDIQSGAAEQYNNQMISRYNQINSTQNPIIFEPIAHPPKTLYILDISNSPDYWTNRCYNVFFKVDKKIILNKK